MQKNININCILLFIKTDMTEKIDDKFKEIIISKIPSARLGEPEDIANAVNLASNQSDYINGETLHVNGGMYGLTKRVFKLLKFKTKRINMSEDVSSKAKKIVADHLGIDEAKVTEESSFIDDFGADSLDKELVMAFEEEFGSEISR